MNLKPERPQHMPCRLLLNVSVNGTPFYHFCFSVKC